MPGQLGALCCKSMSRKNISETIILRRKNKMMLEELPSQHATTAAAAATEAICNIRYRYIHPCCSPFSVKPRGYPAFQLKGITERRFLFRSEKSNTIPLRCVFFSNRKDLAHSIRRLCQSYVACLVRADKLISKMPCVRIVLGY